MLLHLIFDFIDFIFLCFYHHLCNYCNRVFSDQSSNAVCSWLRRGCCYFNMYKNKSIDRKSLQPFRGNNKGERRYKILLCKVSFLDRKDKQRDREPSPFGPFYSDRNDAFSYPSIYFSYWNLYSFVYLKPIKKVPLSRGASPYRSLCEKKKSAIRSPFLAPYMTYGMNTLILCTC